MPSRCRRRADPGITSWPPEPERREPEPESEPESEPEPEPEPKPEPEQEPELGLM